MKLLHVRFFVFLLALSLFQLSSSKKFNKLQKKGTVDEKYKNLNKGNNYQPTVTIATKANANNITVTVTDNGNGMPQEVIEKIFQPFFTTKPTGKGTGLGLSMSYDIIKKGHNGELKVSSTENEGTTFSIIIPNSKA